jgi:hypothetical protein
MTHSSVCQAVPPSPPPPALHAPPPHPTPCTAYLGHCSLGYIDVDVFLRIYDYISLMYSRGHKRANEIFRKEIFDNLSRVSKFSFMLQENKVNC